MAALRKQKTVHREEGGWRRKRRMEGGKEEAREELEGRDSKEGWTGDRHKDMDDEMQRGWALCVILPERDSETDNGRSAQGNKTIVGC